MRETQMRHGSISTYHWISNQTLEMLIFHPHDSFAFIKKGSGGLWRAQGLLCKVVFSTDFSLWITDASTFPFVPLSKICHLQLIDIQDSGGFGAACRVCCFSRVFCDNNCTALHLLLGLNLSAWKLEFIKTEREWVSMSRTVVYQTLNDYAKMPFAVHHLAVVKITN